MKGKMEFGAVTSGNQGQRSICCGILIVGRYGRCHERGSLCYGGGVMI